MRIEIFIEGQPRPAGSKRAFALRRRDGSLVTRPNGSPVINVTDDCKTSAGWKADVREAFRRQWQGDPLSGPIGLAVEFVLSRPKKHFRTGSKSHLLRDDAPHWHTTKPDRGKLLRAVEDALTGIAWIDDAQVCAGPVVKCYGTREGVSIVLTTL